MISIYDVNLDVAKWRAWAREFNEEDSLTRFTAQMLLYNNLRKIGFSPYYSSRMAHGRKNCCLSEL